jgi:hypothetical protein
MTLTTTVDLRLQALMTNALDLVSASAPLDLNTRLSMNTGTAAGQADLMWQDTRTIAASGTEDLDLAGTLTGTLGGTLTLVKLKLILIRAAAANTNNVRVTRPAANGVPWLLAASDGLDVPPGGMLLLAGPGLAGLATVTPATGDLITVANSSSGTSVTYDVVIVGTSA